MLSGHTLIMTMISMFIPVMIAIDIMLGDSHLHSDASHNDLLMFYCIIKMLYVISVILSGYNT